MKSAGSGAGSRTLGDPARFAALAVGLAWAAWAVLLVLKGGRAFVVSTWVYGLMFGGAGTGFTVPGLGSALLHHLAVVFAALVFAYAVAGAGKPLLRLFPDRRRLSRFDSLCVSAVIGWGAMALVFLGLALAGLFHPSILAACALAGCLAGGVPRVDLDEVRESLSRNAELAKYLFIAAFPALLASPLLLVPPTWMDPLIYHLGIPEALLKAHRFVLDGRHPSFSFPLSAELLNALPVRAGREELANFVSLVPFVAGLAFAASSVRERSGRRAAGLAAGLVLASASVQWLFIKGKNDLAVVGMCLMAVSLGGRGFGLLAALVWGVAGGTKVNGMAFAAFAWVWYEAGRFARSGRRWRPNPAWLMLAAVWMAPWLAKNWFCRGDPLWPFLAGVIPGALWDPRYGKAMALLNSPMPALTDIPGNAIRLFVTVHPAVLLSLPLLLVAGRGALRGPVRTALFGACGYLFYAAALRVEYDRMTIPMAAVLALATGAAAVRVFEGLSRRLAIPAMAVFLAVAWSPAPGVLGSMVGDHSEAAFLSGAMPRDAYILRKLSTLEEARRVMAGLPGRRTTLMVEEARAFGWPGHTKGDEFWGQSPTWAFVNRADTVERLRIRFRQAGVSHIAYNFVNEFFPQTYCMAFEWDGRMLGLLREFIRSHAVVEAMPRHVDNDNGGFYIYRVVDRVERPPKLIHYLPGIRSLRLRAGIPFLQDRNPRGSADQAAFLATAFPDVAVFRMDQGFYLSVIKDWEPTYLALAEGVRAGAIGDANLPTCGYAAMCTGRLDEAVSMLTESYFTYERSRGSIRASMLNAYILRAAKHVERREFHRAMQVLEKAASLVPDSPLPYVAMGGVYLKQGNLAKARACVDAANSMKAVDGNSVSDLKWLSETLEGIRGKPAQGAGK
jgi:hypothetical protein